MKTTISITELKSLIDTNHVIHLYPRKLTVEIDGFKYRKVSKSTANWLKGLEKPTPNPLALCAR